jgi:hypothetical protein
VAALALTSQVSALAITGADAVIYDHDRSSGDAADV